MAHKRSPRTSPRTCATWWRSATAPPPAPPTADCYVTCDATQPAARGWPSTSSAGWAAAAGYNCSPSPDSGVPSHPLITIALRDLTHTGGVLGRVARSSARGAWTMASVWTHRRGAPIRPVVAGAARRSGPGCRHRRPGVPVS